jgi:hypothetical protein
MGGREKGREGWELEVGMGSSGIWRVGKKKGKEWREREGGKGRMVKDPALNVCDGLTPLL